MQIWEDEIAQACQFIEEQDEDPAEFRFVVTLEDAPDDRFPATDSKYSVEVACSSMAPITYAGAGNPSWVRLFERDLYAGLYG